MEVKSPASHPPDYTHELQDVIQAEQEYIRARREKNQITHLADGPDDHWGLCLSGGGIRSATLSLGLIQGLTRMYALRRFDYMSTVSGGGYMGACLSSLLTYRGENEDEGVTQWQAEKEHFGNDPHNSPFVDGPGRRNPEGYNPVRDQVHHMRTHSEYLAPQRSVVSRDVMRMVGALLAGTLHNLILFTLFITAFTCIHIWTFDAISNGAFSSTIRTENPSGSIPTNLEQAAETAPGLLTTWWGSGLAPKLNLVIQAAKHHYLLTLSFFCIGLLVSMAYLFWMGKTVRRIRSTRKKRREFRSSAGTRAGFTLADHKEYNFILSFLFFSILTGPLLGNLTGFALQDDKHFWAILAFPFVFSLALAIPIFLSLPLHVSERDQDERLYRSLYNALQGAAFYGILVALVVPIGFLVLFSVGIFLQLLFAVLMLVIGYYVFIKRFTTSNTPLKRGRIARNLTRPIMNLLVLTFTGLIVALIAELVYTTALQPAVDPESVFTQPYAGDDAPWFPYSARTVAGFLFLLSGGLFILLGTLVNMNSMSPHNFYRDRLSEAFLTTETRVRRMENDRMQGFPHVQVRNDEDLLLHEVGDGNGRAPYHIIVAALNLQGTDELVRRTLKSEHFIFTRNYVGSRSTGFVRTPRYHGGRMKLAHAMAISGAAIGSGMGMYTYFAQAFFSTLFNLRLGYWLENPWYNRPEAPSHRWPNFWPYYLFYEMMGWSHARARLINVSDGGHTGDNLGLLPLLQRKCRFILAGDFEEDPDMTFQSFNHALRMALIEENVRIEIDLSRITSAENGVSTAHGEITYPDGSKGVLIYIKSSLPRKLPAQVFNYSRREKAFPHESTGDQFFSDEQFEAYRSLGESLAAETRPWLERHTSLEPIPGTEHGSHT